MPRSALLATLLALGSSAPSGAIDLVPVEHPSLLTMEPAVAEQLGTARRRLDDAVAALRSDGGELATSTAGDESLAGAFGDLGELYLVYDLVAPAAACLENAARLRPSEARWPHLLGSVHEHDRALDAARRWYERAVAIDPDYLPARLRLGRVLATAGDGDAARRVFRAVLDLGPRDPAFAAAAAAGLGRLALADGDPAAAISLLERALELQPQATGLHYPLAQAYRAIGDEQRMRAHLSLRGEVDAGFPDPFAAEVRSQATGVGAELLLARGALRRGDLAGAEARVRRAVALDPASALTHRTLGDVLARAGRWEEARQALREGMRLDPEDVELRAALAGVLERLGRDLEIVEVLDPVVASSPDLAPVRAALGAALARLGEDRLAEGHLARAVDLDPDDAPSRAALARLYGRQGRFLEAAELQARVVELDPSSPEAHLLLATARILGGSLALAIDGLESALELRPDDPRLTDVLARVLATAPPVELRDGERALALATRVYRMLPSADSAETLAMALAETGRFAEAAALEESAIEARQQSAALDRRAVERSRRWLASYRQGQPVREPWKDQR